MWDGLVGGRLNVAFPIGGKSQLFGFLRLARFNGYTLGFRRFFGVIYMNKAILAAVAVAVLASPAAAADLYVAPPVAVTSQTSAFDWSGFYVGANAGYGWGTVDDGTPGGSKDTKGALGGVQVGYNYDLGGFVLGAEADIQFSDISHSEEILPGLTGRAGINSFGTVRARAGVVVDRLMPYVTGGFAYGQVSHEVTGFGGSAKVENGYAGWTLGAGAEYAILDNVTAKAEYLYMDLGKADLGGIEIATKAHVVRAGLNYKF